MDGGGGHHDSRKTRTAPRLAPEEALPGSGGCPSSRASYPARLPGVFLSRETRKLLEAMRGGAPRTGVSGPVRRPRVGPDGEDGCGEAAHLRPSQNRAPGSVSPGLLTAERSSSRAAAPRRPARRRSNCPPSPPPLFPALTSCPAQPTSTPIGRWDTLLTNPLPQAP